MTAPRDPRIDPQVGDEVRIGNLTRRVCSRARSSVRWFNYFQKTKQGDPIFLSEMASTTKRWRYNCKDAEIVHVAGGEA